MNAQQPITLALQPEIEPALESLRRGSDAQCLSDHAFSNLYLFRVAHDYRFVPGAWPGVAGRTYDGASHFMPLFNIVRAPAGALEALINAHGCLYPVASRHVVALAGRFVACAREDDSDYLYDASRFHHYAGRPLAKKRNQVRQFLAGNVPRAVPFDAALADAALAVLAGWMEQKDKEQGEADEHSCIEALAQASRFGFEGFVYFVDDLPVAFLLVQELQLGVFVVRFAKGLDSHAGIYPFMFQHFCRHFSRPVRWLNFEQDMGIAGFRRSKRSYRPSALLQKWRVSLRA